MDDTIRRHDALDEVAFWKKRANEYETMLVELMTKIAKGMTVDSIVINKDGISFKESQPERRTGRWVKHDTGHSIYYDCSLCGCAAPCTEFSDSFIWKLSTYCPDCGAKMGND